MVVRSQPFLAAVYLDARARRVVYFPSKSICNAAKRSEQEFGIIQKLKEKGVSVANEKSKPKVYVETTVISDATALPTRDIVLAARQIATREWWDGAAKRFELFSSDVVAREARRGDAEAAQRRIEALHGFPELQSDKQSIALATELIRRKAVPEEYPDDALHIAVAALNGMDYLVSWNFKHITNGNTIPLVERIVRDNGYACPCICTPQMLSEGGRE